jgi:hypothetical protein
MAVPPTLNLVVATQFPLFGCAPALWLVSRASMRMLMRCGLRMLLESRSIDDLAVASERSKLGQRSCRQHEQSVRIAGAGANFESA